MDTTVTAFAALALVRSVCCFTALETAILRKNVRFRLLAFGWFLWALAPAIRVLSDASVALSAYAACALVGSVLLVLVAVTYFLDCSYRRLAVGAVVALLASFALYTVVPGTTVVTPITQTVAIAGASAYGVSRRDAFRRVAASAYSWVVALLALSLLQSMATLFLYKTDHVIGLVISVGLSALVGLLFVRLDDDYTHARLHSSEERYEQLFDGSADAILVFTPEGEILEANATAMERYGYEASRLLGMDVAQLVLPEEQDGLRARLANTASAGLLRYETRHVTCSGEVFHAEVNAQPIPLADGQAILASVRDVSQRVAAEAELEAHRDNLEQLVTERTSDLIEANDRLRTATSEIVRVNRQLTAANEAKSSFVASMSHELRTPLNSIIGFSQIMLTGMTGEINEEQRKQLTMVNEAGHHLLKLINDVLDLSRIEAGRLEVKAAPCDAVEVVRTIAESVEPLAAEKGLGLSVTGTDSPIPMVTDALKVKQVLLNLVGNAIKFTHDGVVTIDVQAEDDMVRFCVTDTGPGIPEEQHARIFHPFTQVDGHENRVDGTGLGLALSSRMALLLGGTLAVESAPGEGSCFSLVVPRTLGAEGQAPSKRHHRRG